jgi:hypothetical protein
MKTSEDEPAPMTFAEAVRVLEHERVAAEQYAVMLDRFGKADTGRYVQGITLYAEAKADFDGLIEALKTGVIQHHDLMRSPKFPAVLQAAAQKRIAFTSFVTDEVVGDKEGGKGLLYDVIRVVPDLIKKLTESGISIWHEFRDAGKARRDQIIDQLDHLKWKAFADIAKI